MNTKSHHQDSERPPLEGLAECVATAKSFGNHVAEWAVAQKSDYEEIFVNLGSTESDSYGTTYDDNVNAYITGVGGTSLSMYYWSATESGGGNACFTKIGWGDTDMTYSLKVRPVLGF